MNHVIQQQPFVPFTIWLANGRTFRVTHPEFVLLSQQTRTMVVFDPEKKTSSIVDLFHIIEIETEDDSESLPNGSATAE